MQASINRGSDTKKPKQERAFFMYKNKNLYEKVEDDFAIKLRTRSFCKNDRTPIF